MKTSYNEACARDCSTLEQDLSLCEKAGFDYIEIRLDMLRGWLKDHTVDQLKEFLKRTGSNHTLSMPYICGRGCCQTKCLTGMTLPCRTSSWPVM